MTIRLAALLSASAAIFAAVSTPASAQAVSVEIKDAVARVTVIPEDRRDVRVEIAQPNPRLPLSVRTLGGQTVVDGDLGRRIRGCRGSGQSSQVTVQGLGAVGWSQIPEVVIRTPRNVDLTANGAVYGSIGRSASLKLGNAGCGDWTVANVEGDAAISQAGSGGARMGSSGTLKVRVAGSGDLAAAEVRGGLDVTVAGSGSAAVRSLSGPLDVMIVGSGDVDIGGGHVTAMTVSVAGSGDVEFDGSAETLRARITGSGDVRAAEVKGEVTKTVLGSGSVRVGR
ncbi:DUF2807 domain-containing protein [Phenylobacterium sp. SCN 70-31]|uniref:GIN domain-containing protein n=1 Tax=Phenylobacterium sp. SCN 70-31 TaxID=1660129 RepID=UPI000B225836|nr:DUF2807 domain-containing protein [Phenylobacterium sp. SCN 70-31]